MFFGECYKKSCSNSGKKIIEHPSQEKKKRKKKQENRKNNREPWTQKVALRPSGVLLVPKIVKKVHDGCDHVLDHAPLPDHRHAHERA